jgi:hypothetical protein
MRENSTVVIGARIDKGVVKQSWLGNIASFKVYEQHIPASAEAWLLYAPAKAQVDALNAK